LLYTDAGMLPHVSQDWPRFLTSHGYAVLTVDTYAPRNLNLAGMGALKQRMQVTPSTSKNQAMSRWILTGIG